LIRYWMLLYLERYKVVVLLALVCIFIWAKIFFLLLNSDIFFSLFKNNLWRNWRLSYLSVACF
jgi:hypothetical protein